MSSMYATLLEKSKEAIDKIKIPFKVREARLQVEGKINDYELKIAECDLRIEEIKSAHPLQIDTLTEALDDKAITERKLEQLRDINEELF